MFINGHAHVFNLRSVLTDNALDIVRDRVRREVQPEALGDAAAKVVGKFFEALRRGNVDEGKWVRQVVEELTGSPAFGDLRERLPGAARELLDRGLDNLENALLFRLVDGLDKLLNRRQGDARSANLSDLVALLRLAFQSTTAGVARRLMHQLGPDRGAVALMMDITDGNGSDDEQFAAQVQDLSDLVLAYPGRIFPFFAVHTARANHLELMTEALDSKGFVGVKLYPALGSEVGTDAMKEVLREAARLDAPLLSHTTPGGFYKSREAIDFGDPVHWGPLLAQIPDFRICFAHFGGSSNLTKETIPGTHVADTHRRWTARILELMRRHGGRVFTDVSFHQAPMESEDNEKQYFQHLKSFVADPELRNHILFGTDFWVVRTRLSEGSYWRFFQEGVATKGLTKPEFRRLAETNNHRFLGLPLGNLPLRPNIERYVRFVHNHHEELKSQPVPWLLDALRALPDGEAVVEKLEQRDWRLADSLDVPGWRGLAQAVAQDVLDTTLSGDPGDRVAVVNASFSFEAAPLGFQGDGELSLHVFNRVDQFQIEEKKDPDGVLGVAPPQDEADAAAGDDDLFDLTPRPLLIFDPQHAWIKYRAEGHLGFGAQSDLGLKAVGLETVAEKSVVLADYRRHDRSARLREVVPTDLRWPRFALDRDDVLRLEPGDAVSFEAHGRLAARLSVTWADVFSFGLARLARALESPAPLGVEVEAGLSITAHVDYKDDFRLVWARTGKGRRGWRVEVRKAETRGAGFGVRAGVGVRFENPDLAASLLSRRLEAPLNKVEGLLREERLEDLGPRQRKIFDELSERLGIDSLAGLREKVEAWRRKAVDTLDEIVRERLEVAFSYEYSRIETGTALLVAEMDARAVEAFHGALIHGNFAAVLEAADEEPPLDEEVLAQDLRILRYVLVEEEVHRRSWGLSINFGRWLRLAGRDESTLVQRRQRSRLDDGRITERLTYLGSRGYTGTWMDSTWGWEVDLDARMDRVSAHDEPRMTDFTYALGFDFRWQVRELSQRRLDSILDAAALWGVLPAETGGLTALRQRFKTVLGAESRLTTDDLLGEAVEIHLQLLFDQVALARILPRARRDDDAERSRFARALAAAMPLQPDFELHRQLIERRSVYADLFGLYLEEAESAGFVLERRLGDYRVEARRRLESLGHPVEARREGEPRSLERMWTFAGMLAKNRTTAQNRRSCLEGLALLADGVGRVGQRKHSMVAATFKDMARFWNQTHHVRALGAYLLAVARLHGMPSGVSPSLRIELQRSDSPLTVTIGPSAP